MEGKELKEVDAFANLYFKTDMLCAVRVLDSPQGELAHQYV